MFRPFQNDFLIKFIDVTNTRIKIRLLVTLGIEMVRWRLTRPGHPWVCINEPLSSSQVKCQVF